MKLYLQNRLRDSQEQAVQKLLIPAYFPPTPQGQKYTAPGLQLLRRSVELVRRLAEPVLVFELLGARGRVRAEVVVVVADLAGVCEKQTEHQNESKM